MAAIGKIRNQGKLLAFVIGGCLLLFIGQEAFNGQSGPNNTIGVVMGEEIDAMYYRQEVQEEMQRNRRQRPQLTDADREQIENNVWNRLTMTKVIDAQRKALGIEVTPQEIFDVTSINPDQAIKGAFTDPKTGEFSAALMSDFISNLDRATDEQRAQWLDIEQYLEQKMTNEKYNNIFSKSVYTPTWEAEQFYNNRFKKLTAKYVFLDYNEIADEEVSVTDKEILNYIKENKAKYKQEIETRQVDYVTFDITPSKKDSLEIYNRVEGYVNDFKSTDDDSLFVALNSEKGFDKAYYALDKLPTAKDHQAGIFNARKGSVYGPYLEDANYVIAKVLDKKKIADSVECRHILLKPKQTDTRATFFERRDSIMEAINAGSSFANMAKKYSEDPSSAVKGGDLGFAKPGQMVKPFNDKIFFEGDQGKLLTCVTQFGIHIIEVTKYKPSTLAAKVAYVFAEITPSDYTTDSVFNNASNFYVNARKSDAYQAEAEALAKDIKSTNALQANTSMVAGLGNARELVKWAFTNTKGSVSSVMLIDDKYVISSLSGVGEIGLKDIDEVRGEIEFKIRQEKKAQKLLEKYKEALAAKTIEDIATKAQKEISTLSEINFENPYSREIGRDLAVAGTCFGTPEGQLSAPVAGNKGVYVVKPEFLLDAPQVNDYKEYQEKVSVSIKSRTEYSIINALREMAEIRDYRYKF